MRSQGVIEFSTMSNGCTPLARYLREQRFF
jgi:hypothetical protein